MKVESYKNFSFRFHKKNWGNNKPNVCQLELTFGCDLHCQHCYSDCYNKKKYLQKELNTQEAKLVLDKVYKQGVLWLCFTGGDPLTRRDFLDLYAYAKSKGFIITIFTNAYSMNEEIVSFLKRHPPFVIEITLNAVTPKLYEKISQVKGSFSKVMRGIELILKEGLPLKIKTQIMKNNLGEVSRIKRFVRGFGLTCIPSVFLHGRLDGDSGPCQLRISPQEVSFRKGKKEQLSEDCRFLGAASNAVTSHGLFGCAIKGGDGMHIDPYGNLLPCICIREPRINLLQDNLGSAYDRIVSWVRTTHARMESPCAGCRLRNSCYNCPGKALLETGKLTNRLDWFCELAHSISGVEYRRQRDQIVI